MVVVKKLRKKDEPKATATKKLARRKKVIRKSSLKVQEKAKGKKTAKGAKKEKLTRSSHAGAPKGKLRDSTGTRFAKGSKRQLAYELMAKACKKGPVLTADLLAKVTKAGFRKGFLDVVLAVHPDHFKISGDMVRFTGV